MRPLRQLLHALATRPDSSRIERSLVSQTLAASLAWLQAADAALEAARLSLCHNFTVVGSGRPDAHAADQHGEHDNEDGDDDGLGYTIRVSRSQLQSGLVTGDLAPTSVDVRDREAAVRELQSATSALRLLRNACVSNRANQDACGASNAIQLVRLSVYVCDNGTEGHPLCASCRSGLSKLTLLLVLLCSFRRRMR